jgi:ketosteroid isomerase-like protein
LVLRVLSFGVRAGNRGKGERVLGREELRDAMEKWNKEWDDHDLEGVMRLFHEEIIFENWTGGKMKGKGALQQAWTPWFQNHGGFRFVSEDLFIDESEQKVLYQWLLEWPSPEKGYEGKKEQRRGVDVIHFRDGKIYRKYTYSKTTVEIAGRRVKLSAEAPEK